MRPAEPQERQMPTAETHVPPQNLEAEASVLGAMMVSEGAIAPVILDVRLSDEDFYRERHRIVFRAITGLYEQGEPVDALTVSEYLAQHGELAEAGGKEARLRARLDRAGTRQRPPLRPDRQAELAPASPARHLAADPEVRARPRGRARAAGRARRDACCSRSPTRSTAKDFRGRPRSSTTRSTASRRCPRATRR